MELVHRSEEKSSKVAMSCRFTFNKRFQSKPSLRFYFDDLATEADYMDRMNEYFVKAAERNRYVTKAYENLYKGIFKRNPLCRSSFDTLLTDVGNDEVDNVGNVPNKIGRDFSKKHRRRRQPSENNSSTINIAFNAEGTTNRKLIDAVKRNEIETVERLLESGVNPNIVYTLPKREAENLCLTIGIPDEQATWTVLHEASSRGLCKCVRLLLDAGANPNTTGVKQLTALDVAGSAYHYSHQKITDNLTKVTKMLLEAGGKLNSVNGQDLYTPLHTAVEMESIKTIKLLLDAGASVACTAAGRTPLHMCLQTKSTGVLDVLVNYSCHTDMERFERVEVTDKCGFTVLQAAVILNWLPGARIVLEAGAQVTYSATHSKILLWESPDWYQLLQSRQTPIHLAVALNNTEILNMMLRRDLRLNKSDIIDCFNQDGHTPLYTAIKQGRIECVEVLIFEGASIAKVSTKHQNALHVAAVYDQIGIMSFLLEYEEETEHLINNFNAQGYAPLHCAAMNNGPNCVKILLENQANIRLKTFGQNSLTALHIAAGCNYTEVVNVILEHDTTTINEEDDRGFSPLHIAAHNCCYDVMLLLFNKGATLSTCTKGSLKETKTVIEMITNKLPNPTQFFEEVFDSFITSQDSFGMTKINVDYKVLGKINEKHQMKVIEELVRCGQEKILIHPLLESLLYFKWQTLLPFFYVILATYGFFVMSLNILIVTVFYYNDKKENAPILLHKPAWIIAVYISICLLLIQEFFYINIKRLRYFLLLETWVKLSSIALAAILAGTVSHSSWSESEWPRHVATVALLLSWAEVMFLLSRFPNWGYYVLMFGTVSVTIIKILLTFIFMVIAFSFSFMVQFQSIPPFNDLWASLMKTLVMMTSEFDYVSLFNDDNFKVLSGSKIIISLLFLVFLLFVSIVFMNFMVGVAVSDINNLNIRGNTKRLGKLVELLSTLDIVVHDGPLSRVLPRKTFNRIKNKRYLHKMSTFPGSEKTWSITSGDRTNKLQFEIDCKVHLPITLGYAIIDKAKKVKRQKEEESTDEAYTNKIDLLTKAVISGEYAVNRTALESTMKDLNAKVDTMASELAEIKLIHSEMLQKFSELALKIK